MVGAMAGTVVTLRAVSLFSGVGGLDLGLHRAGFDPVLFCEADTYKRAVLAAHWPEVPIHDDVRSLDCDHLTADLVHGGFPCQDVSVAGKRAGLAGNRTGLFWDALRVVDALRPRAVLLENVPGLLSSNDGRDFAVILDALDECGYGVAWRILDAQHFGVPQRRRRVFVLALADDDPRAAALRAGEVLAIREGVRGDPAPRVEAWSRAADDAAARPRVGVDVSHTLTTRSERQDPNGQTYVVGALMGTGGGAWRVGADEAAAGHLISTLDVADTLTHGGHPNSNAPGRRREDDTNLVATAFAQNQRGELRESPTAMALTRAGGKPGEGYPAIRQSASVRRLMPVECERLMGWPDNWTAPPGVKAPDSRRYAACGDGVVAPVAEWIGRRLASELES